MIRDFRMQDLDSVMKLWLDTNILAHTFVNEDYWKNNYDFVKEMIPKSVIFIYEEENNVQGFIGLTDRYIAGIFVSNQFQSKGIGKQLLDYTKNKYSDLSLHVYEKNSRAVHFYQREGFVVSGKQVDENTGEIELVMNWKKSGL